MTRPSAHEIWMGPLGPLSPGGLARPRVGIAGISIESSTFSPHTSDDAAFTVRTGAALLAYYPFLDEGRDLREAAEWVPLTHGRSLPGGAVPMATYLRMKDAILAGLAANGPFDALFLDIHGAMSVVGMDDAEGDLARVGDIEETERVARLTVERELAALRPAFGAFLGIVGGRPDLVIRFGRGPAMPRSLRRPLDAVLL